MAGIVAMAIGVPMAIGDDVVTTANVGNEAPVVCVKWEEPDDQPETPSTTEVMPGTWPADKTVTIKACVCDPNDPEEDIDDNTGVTADVTGPAGFIPITNIPLTRNAAGDGDCPVCACGQQCIQFAGTFDMGPCDPAGTYTVVVTVTDLAGATDTDTNTFEYLGKTVLYIDFGAVAYGGVEVDIEKSVLGDGDTLTSAAPTVHNKGNDNMVITITATEMTPGANYIPGDLSNVDMRQNATVVGAAVGGGVKSGLTAGVPVPFAYEFECCTPDPIDFSINAIPGTKGPYTGQITITGA